MFHSITYGKKQHGKLCITIGQKRTLDDGEIYSHITTKTVKRNRQYEGKIIINKKVSHNSTYKKHKVNLDE